MFSQEELYRNIYNLCCQRHTVSLYTDLMNFMSEHLKSIYISLISSPEEAFIQFTSHLLVNYKRVVDVIAGVFRYLDKVYIKEKLNNSLVFLLLSSFNNSVISTLEIQHKLTRLIKQIPLHSDPSMIMNLVKGLYELNKDYASIHPQLFSMYIPCLQPSRGLDMDIKETLEIIQYLRGSQGFVNSEERILKRKYFIVETT